MSRFWFDPSSLPAGYARVVRITTTAGALVFGAVALYTYILLRRTLDIGGKDVEGALV